MHLTVDPGVCVGSGQCALATPEVFDQDDADGTVVLLDARPAPALHDAVRDAVRNCPVQAISATDQ
ncbi:ferredoxin [Streptomyces sp. CBMA123]|uniref:ferredoxin n=1 Tax=Streptomyces sp. CBMA123 TaxID=1896313 RepID=UPI001661C031|nr:ferredoxin [Streptomyces sp. CBMA123]MBD0689730.1 ferredoxin [Streptomyces sp. CBMA123]